uniref:O-Methyltransferase involved in polyketide biosynthesis n=2 Tax=Candidatus Kentrum sp. FW TaxID=2126338 RepID=A0A450T9F0_9GAMM|nr:MAG: O-Methyltransferase involved in polyketide biosynthesis [Candidatus Kentron sp. FW]
MATQLTGVSETLLIPLATRIMLTQLGDPIVHDPQAGEIIEKLQLDISRFISPPKGISDRLHIHGVAVRFRFFDQVVTRFLEKHPDGTVINLGSGLCTRFGRLDNGRCHWFEVDMPEVIALRRKAVSETERHLFISGSVLETDWITKIPMSHKHHYLIICEGLLMYFSRDEVNRLFSVIAENFPHVELATDIIGRVFVKHSRRHPHIPKTQARLDWAIDHPDELKQFGIPLTISEHFSMLDRQKERLGWLNILRAIPLFGKLYQFVNFRFDTYPER